MPPEGPEAPQQDEQIAEGQKPQAEEPKRSLEDVQKEHDEQRGRKNERDAEEKTERKNEGKGAEDLLEQEIMKELFQDMENGLKGDAKEVFTAVKGELTDAERVDLAKTFNNFQEIADQNHANVNQKLYNTPKEEYLQKARANRSTKVANTFQNSIEQYFEEPDTVSTSAKRLAEETNEKSNNQFQSTTDPNSRLAWKKVGALVEAHVAAHPNKKFKPIDKPNTAVSNQVDERQERMTQRMTEVYAAENLMFEADQARSTGMTVTIRSIVDDHELMSVEEIANEPAVKMDITGPKGMIVDIRTPMEDAGNRFDSVHGEATTIVGAKTSMREGLEHVTQTVKKEKEKRPQ